MSEELIDHYVNRASIADDTKFLTDQLKTVLDQLNKVNEVKITLNGAKGMKEVVDSAKQAQAAMNDLRGAKDKLLKVDLESAKAALLDAKAKKELALASKAEAQARKENAAAALLEAKAVQSLAKAEKEQADAQLKGQQLAANEEKQRKATQKQIDELADDYLQLSRAYTDAAKKAKNYALTLGENHPVTVEAVKDAKAMHDILLRVDQSVGQSQRNVGNYKSAFDGLGVSVTQIARELPSLAISAQQFVLAISNNFPMLADEIKKAKDEIAALKKEGKEAPTLFQRLTAATLSWQVGLSVGIALLTAYTGKIIDWVKGLFDSNVALRAAAKEQALLNEQQQKGLELTSKYNNTVRDSRLNVNRTLADEIEIAKARGDSTAKILQMERELANQRKESAAKKFFDTGGVGQLLDLEIQLSKTKDEYEKFLKTGKAFGQTLRFGTPEFKERESQLESLFSLQSKKVEDQKVIVDDFYNTQRELEIKDIEIKKNAAEQRAKFFADEFQYRADLLKDFSQIEEAERTTRLNARKQALINEKAIIKGQYLDELLNAKNNQVKIFEANREYAFKRKKLAEDYERDVLAIRQSSLKRQQELDQQANDQFKEDDAERLQRLEEQEQKRFEKSKSYIEENASYLLKALDAERNAKINAATGDKERQRIEEEYNNKRKKVELDTNIAIIESSLAVAKAKLETAEKSGAADENQIAKLKAAIASLKEQLEKLKGNKIDLNIDDAKEKLGRIKEDLAEIVNVVNSAFSVVGDAILNNLDRQRNAIQEQIDLIEKRKQADIEAVNALTLSEQEKAAKIAIINAKAQAQKEEQERKQRAIDLQRARFEKAKNIVDIVGRTALAVLEGLIKGGPPLAAVYGAIGAAQLAVAIAQPLPKFKHGREGGPATWSITGDGGVPEVVSSPDLKQHYVTPATDTLTYLPKDWKVFPDVDAFQRAAMGMAMKPVAAIPAQINNGSIDTKAITAEIKSLKDVVKSKPVMHIQGSHAGVMAILEHGEIWNTYVDKSVNF